MEAERSREPVNLLDRDGFIQLLLEHYEALDAEFKAQVPLPRCGCRRGDTRVSVARSVGRDEHIHSDEVEIDRAMEARGGWPIG